MNLSIRSRKSDLSRNEFRKSAKREKAGFATSHAQLSSFHTKDFFGFHLSFYIKWVTFLKVSFQVLLLATNFFHHILRMFVHYCMSILYSNLLYKMGQAFLDTQYCLFV